MAFKPTTEAPRNRTAESPETMESGLLKHSDMEDRCDLTILAILLSLIFTGVPLLSNVCNLEGSTDQIKYRRIVFSIPANARTLAVSQMDGFALRRSATLASLSSTDYPRVALEARRILLTSSVSGLACADSTLLGDLATGTFTLAAICRNCDGNYGWRVRSRATLDNEEEHSQDSRNEYAGTRCG
jgi:hypothetical protein